MVAELEHEPLGQILSNLAPKEMDPERLALLLEDRASPQEKELLLAELAADPDARAIWLKHRQGHFQQKRLLKPLLLCAAAAACLILFFFLPSKSSSWDAELPLNPQFKLLLNEEPDLAAWTSALKAAGLDLNQQDLQKVVQKEPYYESKGLFDHPPERIHLHFEKGVLTVEVLEEAP